MDQPRLQGWHADPFGLHEFRYFSAGDPTKLVRDGTVEVYDEPPAHEAPVAAAGAAPGVLSGAAAAADAGQPAAGHRHPVSVGRATAGYPGRPGPRRRTGLLYSSVALVAVAAVIAFVVIGGGLSSKGGSPPDLSGAI